MQTNIQRANRQNGVITALQNASVPHSKERFLPPGEQFTLWLELQLPDTSQSDFFQVHCHLRWDVCPPSRCTQVMMKIRAGTDGTKRPNSMLRRQ
jgi:hypothetical protein